MYWFFGKKKRVSNLLVERNGVVRKISELDFGDFTNMVAFVLIVLYEHGEIDNINEYLNGWKFVEAVYE